MSTNSYSCIEKNKLSLSSDRLESHIPTLKTKYTELENAISDIKITSSKHGLIFNENRERLDEIKENYYAVYEELQALPTKIKNIIKYYEEADSEKLTDELNGIGLVIDGKNKIDIDAIDTKNKDRPKWWQLGKEKDAETEVENTRANILPSIISQKQVEEKSKEYETKYEMEEDDADKYAEFKLEEEHVATGAVLIGGTDAATRKTKIAELEQKYKIGTNDPPKDEEPPAGNDAGNGAGNGGKDNGTGFRKNEDDNSNKSNDNKETTDKKEETKTDSTKKDENKTDSTTDKKDENKTDSTDKKDETTTESTDSSDKKDETTTDSSDKKDDSTTDSTDKKDETTTTDTTVEKPADNTDNVVKPRPTDNGNSSNYTESTSSSVQTTTPSDIATDSEIDSDTELPDVETEKGKFTKIEAPEFPTSDEVKSSSGKGSSVIPVALGLGAAGIAGVGGAKILKDRKSKELYIEDDYEDYDSDNNEDSDNLELEEYSDYSDEDNTNNQEYEYKYKAGTVNKEEHEGTLLTDFEYEPESDFDLEQE